MSEHTPGPWAYDSTDPNFVEVYETESGNNYLLATVQRRWRGEFWDDPDDETTEANARIMATAPETADVLHAILGLTHVRVYLRARHPELLDRGDTAISKARGQL